MRVATAGILVAVAVSLPACAGSAFPAAPLAPQPAAMPAPPVELTAQQDHQRLMGLLGITSLRPGPSGNPKAPNAANVDEAKATPYTSLPDPLVMKNGRKVTSASEWVRRRAEIAEDFDRGDLRPHAGPHAARAMGSDGPCQRGRRQCAGRDQDARRACG